jgi:general stress protein 26
VSGAGPGWKVSTLTNRLERGEKFPHENQTVEAWFPDGPDTPEVVLLHVDSDSAEYWTSPGGTAATVLQWVKSRVAHSRMSVGESGTVEL